MRITALSLRIIKQIIHDKRTMALLLIAPMLILSLMSAIFNGSAYHPTLGVIHVPEQMMDQFKEYDASVFTYLSRSEADKALNSQAIDAYIQLDNGVPQVKLEGSDPSVNMAVLQLLQQVTSNLDPSQSKIKPVVSYLHGSAEMSAFDRFGPILIGVFAFLFVFLIAGVSFLRERTGGTLERLLTSPIRRSEIVAGYVLGFGVFTILQAAVIAWFSISILGIIMEGSMIYVLLITLLLSLTALTLGILLSSFANNEFQMLQFIPLVIVPQIFFSGLFNLSSMAPWLQIIARILPLTYGADALRDIMIRGKGWDAIATNVVILVIFSLVFMMLNVIALRKHRVT